ncbi:unnamed protein product [Phytomonas sp. Hart1]|nr:unnamed protein product [Phytomonas sp. Hart1]|eukprot:CCW68215.1 unnamed protein product [Phytomonas sp. isolate Hart1]
MAYGKGANLHSLFSSYCDDSSDLQAEVDQFSLKNVDSLIARIEACVHEVVSRAFLTTCWAKTYLFGSSGLGAAIEGSDVDLYVYNFPQT